MAWTAELKAKRRPNPETIIFTIAYLEDGIEIFDEDVRVRSALGADPVKSIVRQKLAELEGLDGYNPDNGPVDPTPTPPTQAELDADAWFADLSSYTNAKHAIAEGWLDAQDTTYTSLVTRLNDDFKKSYLQDDRYGFHTRNS